VSLPLVTDSVSDPLHQCQVEPLGPQRIYLPLHLCGIFYFPRHTYPIDIGLGACQ